MGNSSSDPHRHFSQYFESGDRLGAGTFAVVKKCTRKKDGHEFAVKIIDKRHLTGRELVGLQDEIRILQTIKHPNVISSVDAFDDGRRVKIVLELCAGGDLFDQILKSPNRRFSEEQSARVTAVTARALKALHDSCVVHRDLKPENILFTENGVLKITDFGLAHYLKLPPELHIMHTCCGTPHYVAPEVLASNEYGVEVDFWSLGVILYIMLSGYQPFNSHSIHAMYGMIIRGQYRFPSPHWDHVTEEAKDCVKKLMCVEAKARLNADTLFDHPWINQHVDLNQLVDEESRLREEIRRIHVGDDERKDGGAGADHSRSSDRERERERDRDRRHNDGDVSMSDKTKAPEKAIVEEEAPPVGTNI